MTHALALLTGGLDSMLAIRVMQDQGVAVEGVNFRTVFTCCKDRAEQAARQLNVPLTVIGLDDEYIERLRRPRFGYGKGANPCVDCRIHMFQSARRLLEERGADLVISGEVLGQRPMSQKRRDLEIVARESALEDRLLRPLSAKLLPPTAPERSGQIDRQRLFAFCGRGRKGLIALARSYGFAEIPTPSPGCALAEKSFAHRVHDLIQLDTQSTRWDFELLKVGRHLRLDPRTKAVVGRREAENKVLRRLYRQPTSRASALLVPATFMGPTVVVTGPPSAETLDVAGGLVLRFAKTYNPEEAIVRCDVGGRRRRMRVYHHPQAATLTTL